MRLQETPLVTPGATSKIQRINLALREPTLFQEALVHCTPASIFLNYLAFEDVVGQLRNCPHTRPSFFTGLPLRSLTSELIALLVAPREVPAR